MVLRVANVASLLLLTACITARPVARSRTATSVAAAFVLDSAEASTVEAAPTRVVDRVSVALADRNVSLVPQPAADWADTFSREKLSRARLQTLAKASSGARIVLLVETRAVFDALLNGRYRWNVTARATMARTDDLANAMTTELEFPAILDYDFQHASDAVALAAPEIADRIGQLADQFIAASPDHAGRTPMNIVRPALAWRPAGVGPGDSIYFVLVDRFFDGDPTNDGAIDRSDPQAFHGGDLQGVIDKLDYLQNLGVTTVWLSPVFKMQTSKFQGHGAYHGYWVEDFSRLEPRFGDESTLRKLAEELHRRGMKLLLDVVLNHVAYDSPLVKEHPDWFHHHGDIKDWSDATQLTDNDVDGLPDLAQENPAVFEYLVKTSEHWIDSIHPDGFRLDAVKHIPASFWARYNDAIRAHAGETFFLLGEDLDGDPQHVARTMREGHFSSMFDFPLYFATIDVFCNGAPPERVGSVLAEDPAYDHPERLVSVVDNHDLPRLVSACHGDEKRAQDALYFSMVARGISSLTYGTENLQPGAADPDNRADMKFDASPRNRDEAASALAMHQKVRALLGAAARVVVSSPSDGKVVIDRSADGQKLSVSLSLETRGRIAISSVTSTDSLTTAAASEERTGRAQIEIRAKDVPASTSDAVLVVGSGSLGDWTPDKGIRILPMADGTYAGPVRVPANDICAFKLVVKYADGRVLWESVPNRYLAARADEKALDIVWNGPLVARASVD